MEYHMIPTHCMCYQKCHFLIMERNTIILGIMNYQGKFLPSTAEMCEPLRKHTSTKCKWTLKNTYQNLHDRVKIIIKKSVTIVLYNEKEQLYPETDVSDVGLGAEASACS